MKKKLIILIVAAAVISGFSLFPKSNTKKTAEQYAVIGLKCVATDTFTLTGERELA